MADRYQPDADRELDRLLAQARWPDPQPAQIDRLAAAWRQARRRRTRIVYAGLAMAASLLLVAGTIAWRNPRGEPAGLQVGVVDESRAPAEPATEVQPAQSLPAQGEGAAPLFAREPNLYERLLLARQFPRRDDATSQASEDAQVLEELIDLFAADASADPDPRWASLGDQQAESERQLWDLVRGQGGRRRLGAARLLARVGRAESVPVLADLLADPDVHETAIVGLARLASADTVARLARVEPQSDLRKYLAETLLARRTAESVGRYLDLVRQPTSRREALAALATMQNPPADLLLAYLQSPDWSLRMSAAQALGQATDPQIAPRLVQAVADGTVRQEALIALLLSPTAQAANFMSLARQDHYLVAAVLAAEQQLNAMKTNGGNLP